MINKEILLRASAGKGLTNKEHIEKDYFQDLLLYHLYKQTNQLVFKGGTALYKFYQLPRFSEDLDFAVLSAEKLEETIRLVVEKIPEARLIQLKVLKTSLLAKIRFKGILTAGNTVRLDISTDNPLLEKFEIRNYTPVYIDLNPFALRLMSLPEILAEKIHSLAAREKARDLYDLFFLLRFVKLDQSLVQKKLAHFGLSWERTMLLKRIADLEPAWEKELGPFILGELPAFSVVNEFVTKKLLD